MLSAGSHLNEALDEDTFSALGTAVAARIGSVGSAAIAGEQRLNSLHDAITVDSLAAHYNATQGGSLPSSGIPLNTDKINSTIDTLLLSHVVKYLKDVSGAINKPVNSVVPVITGDGDGPFTVSSPGTWSNSPTSYTYQWQSDGVDIGGQTTSTLAKSAAYDGHDITCDVHAVNAAGTSVALATSNTITAFGVPVNSVAPVIEGTSHGPFDVSDTGTWSNSPTSFTYQWQGDGVDIDGETTDTLAADIAYVGVDITCDVTAHNASGASTAATSNTITGA